MSRRSRRRRERPPIQRHDTDAAAPVSLPQLFWIFFRIACTSFGGFMAIISVVQNVVVERRKLLAHQEMLDGISLATLLPGPTAVNVVAYVGYRLRGGAGAATSVCAAVLPPFVLIMALSIAYFRWGNIPAVSGIFMGFVPAVAAIILAAGWNMARKSITGVREGAIAAVAAAILLGVGGFFSTLAIVIGAGLLGWWWFRKPNTSEPHRNAARSKTPTAAKARMNQFFLDLGPLAAVPLAPVDPTLLLKLFAVFGGMSLMLFGGGYVFIPLIGEVVVKGQGWLTQREFIDGVALGQIMPGPILVSAAFIGYKVAGVSGAAVATLGMFGPPALLMVGCTRLLERMKKSNAMQASLRGVRPAVIGMIFAAVVIVGKHAVPAWTSVAIFAVALIALLKLRADAVWVIPAAGLIGFFVY
ncbi:MAG: chromate efflux transporter [Sulfurifustis sp.]